MDYSVYYQARVQKEISWMVTACVRYLDHVAFDRTLDKDESIFEFFVSPDFEAEFLSVAQRLLDRGVFLDLKKLPNRLIEQDLL
jgi:hypothetical protein